MIGKTRRKFAVPQIKPILMAPPESICATSVIETCNTVQTIGHEIGDTFDFTDNTSFNQTWED